jgi:peptidoglycan/xylan/chitin deacetylase (PgdA/CDA1 family)
VETRGPARRGKAGPVKARALLYHDVVVGTDYRSSGFAGDDANLYKLERAEFELHLAAIGEAEPAGPATIYELLAAPDAPRILLTFDDGGASARDIADLLELRGWRAHFFIPTQFIGQPAFLSASEIRDLHGRGHVIGSHSSSHPPRLSLLPRDRIAEEWTCSTAALADILGANVETASVPTGSYSRVVARAAAEAGVRILFNSEPVMRVHRAEGCWVVGRFGLQRGDSARKAAGFAAGAVLPRLAQWSYWNTKKAMRAVGGEAWLALRKRLISRTAAR